MIPGRHPASAGRKPNRKMAVFKNIVKAIKKSVAFII